MKIIYKTEEKKHKKLQFKDIPIGAVFTYSWDSAPSDYRGLFLKLNNNPSDNSFRLNGGKTFFRLEEDVGCYTFYLVSSLDAKVEK